MENKKYLKFGKKIMEKVRKNDEEGYLFKNFDITFYLGVFEFYL